MTIKELKELLDQYDEDIEVITEGYENITGVKMIGVLDEHFIKLVVETAAERQKRQERGLE